MPWLQRGRGDASVLPRDRDFLGEIVPPILSILHHIILYCHLYVSVLPTMAIMCYYGKREVRTAVHKLCSAPFVQLLCSTRPFHDRDARRNPVSDPHQIVTLRKGVPNLQVPLFVSGSKCDQGLLPGR